MIGTLDRRIELHGAVARLWTTHEDEILLDGPRGTGKTFGVLRYCDWAMRKFPGVRIVWARDTLVNLRGSAMLEFEDFILWPGHPALQHGGSRQNRTQYVYGPDPSNPGLIECIGLDNISKTQSKEADIIVVYETTTPGVREHHWTILTGMLRGMAIPHPLCRYPDGLCDGIPVRQLMMRGERFKGGVDEDGCPLFFNRMIADCNPTSEAHWLWRRHKRGLMKRLRSKHEDNPMVKADYIKRLEALPPVMKRRWLHGEWCEAEGLVWETYSPDRHVVTVEFEREPLTGRRYIRLPEWMDDHGTPARLPVVSVIAGFDWGHTDPGVLLVGAVTQDGRVFVFREWYETGQGYDVWAERIAHCVDQYGLECVRFSAERPEGVDILNKLLGPRHGREAGGVVQLSDRRRMTKRDGDLGGLDVVRELFRKDRLFFARDRGQVVDRTLEDRSLFTTVCDEIPAYVKGTDPTTGERLEAPDEACVDHGCEALRYLNMDTWFREYAQPKETLYIPAPGTVAYQTGTNYERARLRELQKARSGRSLSRGRLSW